MPAARVQAWPLGRIVLLALLLRMAWLVLCPNEPTSDQWVYHSAAKHLAEGAGYLDADGRPANYWPVGYAAMLAPFYRIFGAHFWVAYIVNIALSLAIVLGVARLGTELFGTRAGRLAALLAAVHPSLILHATIFASETPFCAGTVWLLWLVVRTVKLGTRLGTRTLLIGALLGLLVYVRPTAQVFVLLVPLTGLLWRKLPLPRLLWSSTSVVLCAFLVLLPWGLRNLHAFDEFTLTSMNAGANFWMGNNPETRGVYMSLPTKFQRMAVVQRDEQLGRMAAEFVLAEPRRYVELCLARAYLTLRSDTIGAVWNQVGITHRFGPHGVRFFSVLCSLAHWALLVAVGSALWIKRRELGRADLALALSVGLLAMPFVLVVGGNRYMVPIVPLLCAWAASILREPAVDGSHE